MAKVAKSNRSHSSRRKRTLPMIRSVMKMEPFPLLKISRTLLVARNQRRIIIRTMTSKLSPVPLLLRGKSGVRPVQHRKLRATASAQDLQSRPVLHVRRGLIKTKCKLCIVLPAAKDPNLTIATINIMGTISTRVRTILRCNTACHKWWRNTPMDTPTPTISILTRIIMVTHLAQTRSTRMISKAQARRMQKDFVTVTSTSSGTLIKPPLPKPRYDSCRIDNTAVRQPVPQSSYCTLLMVYEPLHKHDEIMFPFPKVSMRIFDFVTVLDQTYSYSCIIRPNNHLRSRT